MRRSASPPLRTLVAAIALLGVGIAAAAPQKTPPRKAPDAPDFARTVRPLLAAHCLACHGPDDAARKAGLRLDVPLSPEKARAVRRRLALPEGAPGRMPPAEHPDPLTAASRALLLRWVDSGAPHPVHWAWVRPVATGKGDAAEIDQRISEKLRAVGLTLSPPADRRTLIRRAALDLTGLPPTPEEADAFVADTTPGAWERVVDRLLASPRYGEHWARLWMDLARYADTKGYEKDQPRTMWRWRDRLIDAFNRDQPYDQFTAEQLAGDLLPNATLDQQIATAFHRNTMTNDEGGTDDEEFRQLAVKDRIDTTAQVWMGLTLGCAKCHSHKYDPITQGDYYRFYAIFNQTEDADRYDEAPTLPSPTPDQQRRQKTLDAEKTALRAGARADAGRADWERALAARRSWTPLALLRARTTSGAQVTGRPDRALVVSGPRAATERTTLVFAPPAGKVTALRLEALNDPSLPAGGPGRDPRDQNAVVSELRVRRVGGDGSVREIALARARADFAQKDWPATAAIDGKEDTGWAWAPQNGAPHVAVFDLAEPQELVGGILEITLTQNYPNLALGCLRLATSADDPATLTPEVRPLADLAAVPVAGRTVDDAQRLDDAFLKEKRPERAARLAAIDRELQALTAAIPKTPVLRELLSEKRRVTRIHRRGNFLDPGDPVAPAVLPGFGPAPSGAPDRLAAARWLTSPENPLTARVAVNRIWARLFGVGIVETEEDFGIQGAAPSHPELLDALAVAFRTRLGWSQKRLLKTILLSRAYQQSARVTPDRLAKDPANRLLSRAPRFRLPAEGVRDQALAAAGLLSARVGGPPAMPPQPEGVWRAVYSGLKWETGPGEERYRRGLYTFWRRTSPYPAMTTFDAGSGEVCLIRRIRTNTPLQALVTLNDPAFVEAAAALGARMAQTPGGFGARLDTGFRALLCRRAAPAEAARLETLWRETLSGFRKEPQAATDLLRSANRTISQNDDPGILAAWAVVGNVLLNLDETVTRP